MPGTDVSIGRYGPRISSGAAGFHVERVELRGASIQKNEDAMFCATFGLSKGRFGRSSGKCQPLPATANRSAAVRGEIEVAWSCEGLGGRGAAASNCGNSDTRSDRTIVYAAGRCRSNPEPGTGIQLHEKRISTFATRRTACEIRGNMTATSAISFVPDTRSLAKLREAAESCQGCELFRRATQTVFGEGPARARLMLVGETPGDQEDIAGHPFVGAAGKLLNEALAEAGINREKAYVTNAVKHFKWTPRGKKRLHAKPNAREILACRPWLEAEIACIHPALIVCLGATASQTLLGRSFRITRERGKVIEWDGPSPVLATYHPSAILRAPDEKARRQMRQDLVDDLQVAAEWLAKAAS